jgi:16S rRNA (guanine966-N2)-methyltransferase
VADRATLLVTSAFLWAKRDLLDVASRPGAEPWLVFCSPPYSFYVERRMEMLELIGRIQTSTPPGSILIVEADEQFDFSDLRDNPAAGRWQIRTYPPAVIGIWRGGGEAVSHADTKAPS